MKADGSYFSGDWLALREPVDHRSRAHVLVERLNRFLRASGGVQNKIVDLGAGNGSNWRYLDARLAQPAHWRLLDHDAALLASMGSVHARGTHGTVTTQACDLVAGALPALVAGVDLVTASALLDLTSAAWMEALCAACAQARAALLVALTIDGRVVFSAPDPQDALVLGAVARDQQRDKGFGPALGADAVPALIRVLAAQGYQVTHGASDWHLGAADAALARALVDGWREAAACQRPNEAATFAAWAERRTQSVASGGLQITVGHVDVLGLPP